MRWLLWLLVVCWATAWVVNRSLRAVTGPSMQPTLQPGDRLVVVPTWLRHPRRGDVVVAEDPRPVGPGMATVKRLVGLPGEDVAVRPGTVEADGRRVLERPRPDPGGHTRRWQLGDGELLLLGDNPAASTDGRAYGPVRSARLKAVVVWRVRPWGPLR